MTCRSIQLVDDGLGVHLLGLRKDIFLHGMNDGSKMGYIFHRENLVLSNLVVGLAFTSDRCRLTQDQLEFCWFVMELIHGRLELMRLGKDTFPAKDVQSKSSTGY